MENATSTSLFRKALDLQAGINYFTCGLAHME
jgi:hypothetical protein